MAATATSPRIMRRIPDLATIRASKGISLDQIAEATKIRVHYLRAIERSQFDQLPGGVFNTSYIRQYARAIDYDECDLLAWYDAIGQPEEPAPPPEPKRGLLRLLVPEPILRLFTPAKRA